MEDKICKEEGCLRPVLAKEICKYHYNKLWAQKNKKTDKLCKFSGCPELVYSKGFCRPHYLNNLIIEKRFPNLCLYCGTKMAEDKRRRKYCNPKCRSYFFMYGSNQEIYQNRINYRNEALIILTKWKWGFVDPLLYYRTIDLYIKIVGFNFNMIKDLNSEKTIKLCLSSIKKIYNLK